MTKRSEFSETNACLMLFLLKLLIEQLEELTCNRGNSEGARVLTPTYGELVEMRCQRDVTKGAAVTRMALCASIKGRLGSMTEVMTVRI